MYKKGNIIYAAAGKCLKRGASYGYQLPDNGQAAEEIDVDLSDIRIVNDIALLNGGKIAQRIGDGTKKWLKMDIIGKRYDNNDQLAILLNGREEDILLMQSWRDFADRMAMAIIEQINTI